MGGAIIIYMMLHNLVDPKRAKLTFSERVQSPWIIISVVGGAFLGRMIIQRLSSIELEVLFLSFMLTLITLVTGYMLLKIWRVVE